jgi:hypothetical protein
VICETYDVSPMLIPLDDKIQEPALSIKIDIPDIDELTHLYDGAQKSGRMPAAELSIEAIKVTARAEALAKEAMRLAKAAGNL